MKRLSFKFGANTGWSEYPSLALIEVNVTMRNNVVSLKQTIEPVHGCAVGANAKGLVARCRTLVSQTLPRLLQDLFEKLDDNLYELSDKSTNGNLQTGYFQAMRDLRKLRGIIADAYQNDVLGVYDNFWRGANTSKGAEVSAIDEDSLSLVDDTDLELDLAVESMISKAEGYYRRELFALNQRLAFLAGADQLGDAENPVGPSALANGFRRAMRRWEGELTVQLVVFKLFDRHVMHYVGGLYDELNDLLVKADVLPKISQRARRNPVAPSIQRARNPSSQSTEEPLSTLAVSNTGEDVAPEIISMLSELLSTRRVSEGRLPAQHLPVVPAGELLRALTDLQQSMRSVLPASVSDAHVTKEGLGTRLMEQLGASPDMAANRRFGENEQNVIDVISMLFEFILDDRHLPDAMRALLSRLQIPMLKVAVVDRSFFAAKNHPARRLLNDLANASVGWVDDGDRSANSLYGCVAGIVERILNEFVDDVRLFEVLGEEFGQFLRRADHTAQIAEERINQVNRGQEQLKLARSRVDDVLESRLAQAGSLVPAIVNDLLHDAWKDVLLLVLLREGEESDSWRHNLKVAERLIWSVQPKTEQVERQKLLRAIPDLLQEIREGLGNISFDQHKSAQMFKELQVSHIAALRGLPSTPPATAPVPIVDDPVSRPEDAVANEVESSTVESDAYDELASSLAVGSWVEWEEQGKQVRGKLSWKSAVTGTYVFVSRKGTKVAEMTADDIAALLRSGSMSVLESAAAPLMDRALGAVLDTLSKNDQTSDA